MKYQKEQRPTLEELQIFARDYPVVPVAREIMADMETPIAVMKKMQAVSSCCFMLESAPGGTQRSRYSFLGFDPSLELKCKAGKLTVTGSTVTKETVKDPAPYIRKILAEYKSPRLEYLPTFTGGFVGYFAYEYCRYCEAKLDFPDVTALNDVDLMLFDKVIAFDHLLQKIVLIVNIKTNDLAKNFAKAQLDLDTLERLVTGPLPQEDQSGRLLSEFSNEFDLEEYKEVVNKAKHYIKEGDIFQVVPSNDKCAKYQGSLLNAYRVLRSSNPSPYMCFFSGHAIQMMGASPETLVKLTDGKIATFPIAGTAPRGTTPEGDRILAEALLSDEKEMAEHNMLVDLGRNDLGRIAEFGSVKVKDYQALQKFSRVMHITSTVEGQIREGLDGLDAIRATLPAGTLSGAPKIRAMEIIHELEKSPRGIYGGAVGYLDFTGNMDVCIGIRMAVKYGDEVHVRSGGGVVADSVPEKEYTETVNKAAAVIDAIKLAQEV